MIEEKILAILLVTLKAESFIIIPYSIIWLTFTEILNKITKKGSYHARNFSLQSWVYNKREFLQIKLQKPEQATGGVLEKNVFLEISQNSQEKTCARASFFIKL